MEKTLGGDRLGAGKKMTVNMHGYERSTHDLGYLWRSTMAAGTLVPFMSKLALPGDTFDINLDCDVKTHPTIGPLFGSYKVQMDVFQIPIRLYQAKLHNNALGIGMNMAQIKLPVISLTVDRDATIDNEDPDNSQINPSSLLAYLGIRGVGILDGSEVGQYQSRYFNAIPFVGYWDIYKNYYANKQEEIGYVIHTTPVALVETIDEIRLRTIIVGSAPIVMSTLNSLAVLIDFTGTTPLLEQIIFNTDQGPKNAAQVINNPQIIGSSITGTWRITTTGTITVNSWSYITPDQLPVQEPIPTQFELQTLDQMRNALLSDVTAVNAIIVNGVVETGNPIALMCNWVVGGTLSPMMGTQEGLGIKTYNSDLFNNWLNENWIQGGVNSIAEITAIDTTSGQFTIDTLNLSRKVYNMLNRIAVSGGSYDDWLDAVYTHDRFRQASSPIYHGGLIKELVFQEVVSNSESTGGETPTQPLGTLAGKGVMAKKHKGGNVRVKVDEPSYIMGIISLTPRIDYSQGNSWDMNLKTLDDLHKPALDEIGFQDLLTEQMAWWSTEKTVGEDEWISPSAGKQPAWINYMTSVNEVRGNFAIPSNEMFMTLNRRYEYESGGNRIKDLTTYIDPAKYNNIFAETQLDAQNFWVQVSVDITARRKMSAKLMPNL